MRATISKVANATSTLRLSLKDKVLVINLVSRNISGTKIRFFLEKRVKESEKMVSIGKTTISGASS